MKRIFMALSATCLFLFATNGSFAQASDTALARKFIELNNKGQFDSAKVMFAPELQSKISAGLFQAAWSRFNNSHGQFNHIISLSQTEKGPVNIVNVICDFEKAQVVFTCYFTASHFLQGFFQTGVKEKMAGKKENQNLSNTTSIDTSVTVNGGKIYGTLLIPDKEKKYPLVLIIAGSGPTDRNGNSALGEDSNMYLMLADSLAKHGIASFRYDKRYSGESTDFPPSGMEHMSFDDYVNDAVDVLRFLNEYPHATKMTIAGHSEGSLIGMIAAQKTRTDAYISLSGAGENISKILLWQFSKMPGSTEAEMMRAKNVIDSVRNGRLVEDVPPYLHPFYLTAANQHYYTSWMKYNPDKEIKKLHIPVLIVNGTHDIQVPVEQAEILHHAGSGAELAIIPGMNHILKDAPEDRMQNIATYNEPDLPLNDILVEEVVQFIKSVPSRSHS